MSQQKGDLKKNFQNTNEDLNGQIRSVVRSVSETMTIHMIQPLLAFTSVINKVLPTSLGKWLLI